jgi:hypothetical protein
MDNITPRDMFAAAALQGMISFDSEDGNWGDDYRALAEHAFIFADEMMTKRKEEMKRVEEEESLRKAQDRKEKDSAKWEPILSVLQSPMLASDWFNAVKDWGLSRTTFFRYLEDMKDAGLVEMNPADNKYERTENK